VQRRKGGHGRGQRRSAADHQSIAVAGDALQLREAAEPHDLGEAAMLLGDPQRESVPPARIEASGCSARMAKSSALVCGAQKRSRSCA
jgi:hypothetical protein